ncbi:hypothetical protein V1264_006262 [Littorina saxatilis]|uniref:DUF7789 domain-containing protein n=2 Tax=Littorina saxatilis TaxID=31220 RepID=A0AAN9AWJ8_9CAEN
MRTWDIIIFALATFLVWLHILVHFILGDKTASEWVRLIVSSIGGLICILLAVKLASGYGMTGIKHLVKASMSAIEHTQNLYFQLLLFTEFLTFNMQLSLNLLILSVTSRLKFLEPGAEEIVIMVIWPIFTVAFILLGYNSMLRENYCGALCFFALCPWELGFIIYRIVRVSMTETVYKDRYLEVCTYVCGPLTAVFLGIIILHGRFRYKNFGKGLVRPENPESDRQGLLDQNRLSTSANRN